MDVIRAPIYRRVLVAMPAEPGPAFLEYAELASRLLSPEAVRLLHLAPGREPGILDSDGRVRIVSDLPPLLRAMRESRDLSIGAVNGDVLSGVLQEAVNMRADLLIVPGASAASSRRAFERRLAMMAPCSVWMVPAEAVPRVDRILAPVDFSPRSADALDVATAIAERAGSSSCRALHVRFNSTLAAGDEVDEILAGEEQEAFSIFAARVDLHGVDPDPVFEEGADVSRTILRVAAEQQADLVVMGTRGRTRAASMLIGSETEHTLQSSDIPVLAIKHFGSRLRFLEALVDSRFRQKEEPRFS
jgi:nucleotide-binding universal stress UspA family protein